MTYLITFACYGCHLHGAGSGSIDTTHNVPGTPVLNEDSARAAHGRPRRSDDAYATGQALYTMHEAGVQLSDPAYRRGVQYLLETQAADGSWRVTSRAPKFQPYFETIFPYQHDQWISSWATAWSAAALSYASGVQEIAKR